METTSRVSFLARFRWYLSHLALITSHYQRARRWQRTPETKKLRADTGCYSGRGGSPDAGDFGRRGCVVGHFEEHRKDFDRFLSENELPMFYRLEIVGWKRTTRGMRA